MWLTNNNNNGPWPPPMLLHHFTTFPWSYGYGRHITYPQRGNRSYSITVVVTYFYYGWLSAGDYGAREDLGGEMAGRLGVAKWREDFGYQMAGRWTVTVAECGPS